MTERRRPSDQALVRAEAASFSRFFGKEVIPQPPKELLEFVDKTTRLGFTFEPYFEPAVTFSPDANYPGWKVKPDQWFWDMIRQGKISPEAARLSGAWMAMEALQKPDYTDGTQLYTNDPLAPILEKLRAEGKIEVPDWCKHIPPTSRFGSSPIEIEQHVATSVVEMSGLKSGDLGLPGYMSWNYRGNIAHPEWGETNTWEWFRNKFGTDYRLLGGHSRLGGLAVVDCYLFAGRDDSLGFRLSASFPSSKS